MSDPDIANQAIDGGRPSEIPTALPPAGWYSDPQGGPCLRFWDGGAWTERLAPLSPDGVPTFPRRSRFNILEVVENTSSETDLFPSPGPRPNSIELHEAERATVEVIIANAVTVSEITSATAQVLARLRDRTFMVFITDERVALACSEYDKGGGWFPMGGAAAGAVALTANAVSKARAKRRREGKTLVAQARYAWLVSVGFKTRNGRLSREILRLTIADPTDGGRFLALDLTLDAKATRSSATACGIARRAASYRLANEPERTPGAMNRLRDLATAEEIPPVSDRFASYFLLEPITGLNEVPAR